MDNEMLSLQINSRFDTKSCLYFDICRESWQLFTRYDIELKALMGLSGPLAVGIEFIKVAQLRRENWVKSMVFGALCLEAFIYDYAAHNFSDTYAKKYLDKLDLPSKWVIIPKLVTGKEFSRGSQAFEYLGELVKVRNELVHAKSKRMPRNQKEWIQFNSSFENRKSYASLNPYETVIEVLTELCNLDKTTEDIWWELKEFSERADPLPQ